MKKVIVPTILAVILSVYCATAFAAPPNTLKVTPHGVDYPLVLPVPYPSLKGDPYERHFGVRRWLNTLRPPEVIDAERIVDESSQWFQLYGSYGVTGHGEDVFTRKAAHFRRTHRGR
jgi:hypothetical protein